MHRFEINEAPAVAGPLSSVAQGDYFIVKNNHDNDVVYLRLPYLGIEDPGHTACLCFDGEGRIIVFLNETLDVTMVVSKVTLFKQSLG